MSKWLHQCTDLKGNYSRTMISINSCVLHRQTTINAENYYFTQINNFTNYNSHLFINTCHIIIPPLLPKRYFTVLQKLNKFET